DREKSRRCVAPAPRVERSRQTEARAARTSRGLARLRGQVARPRDRMPGKRIPRRPVDAGITDPTDAGQARADLVVGLAAVLSALYLVCRLLLEKKKRIDTLTTGGAPRARRLSIATTTRRRAGR